MGTDGASAFLGQSEALPPGDAVWLARALDIVRERRGLDFRGYRASTLWRRLRNRMIAANVRTLPEYLDRLRADADEAAALVEKLTIKVSRFFRDAAAFEALGQALALRRQERAGGPLRVWSAGCGQGEEPYSLSILLEGLGQRGAGVEVLATDVDPAALSFASAGCYPLTLAQGLTPWQRTRYFDGLTQGRRAVLRVKPELRARVEFRFHDLVRGPAAPGGLRFDLVCCRNVLIYFQPELQQAAQARLVGSLLPGALLCLGEAEWLLPPIAPFFDVVDRRARLFKRRPGPGAESR